MNLGDIQSSGVIERIDATAPAVEVELDDIAVVDADTAEPATV